MSRRHGAEARRESVLLIVLEPGSAWPSGIESPPSADSADTIVLASDNDDSPGTLTRRALERVAAVETRGHRLGRAVVVAGTMAPKPEPRGRSSPAPLLASQESESATNLGCVAWDRAERDEVETRRRFKC